MSAPTALDRGALRVGLAWQVIDQAGQQDLAPDGRDRRSRHPVAVLSREHDDLCTQATDPFEIAAGLEAAGVSDRRARTEYGVGSVFELAEVLYQLVPRRPRDLGAPRDPWRRPLSKHLLRGLLYSLPGLLYVVALRFVHGGPQAVLLLCATVIATAAGQGLSVLGHVLMERGERRAAAALFRRSLAAGAVLMLLLALAGWLLPWWSLRLGVLAGCQVEYLLAATVLMVVDADLLLLAVLVPGVLVAAGVLSGGLAGLPVPVVVAVLAGSLLAAVSTAASRVRVPRVRPASGLGSGPGSGSGSGSGSGRRSRAGSGLGSGRGRGRGRGLRSALGGVELHLAGAYALYGAVNAGLLSFAVVDVLTGAWSASGTRIAVTMLPLVVSLGLADWLLHRMRSGAIQAMLRTASPSEFRARAGVMLVRTVLSYAGILAVFTGLVFLWIGQAWHADPVLALNTLAYAVLGVAFFLDMILLSLGLHRIALWATSVALAGDALLRIWVPAGAGVVWHANAHLAVFSLLLVALYPVVRVEYGSAARHR